jgi:integrase
MFEADQIRQMLDAAKEPLRTMILLGVNCGFGNNDCGTLRLSALDLDKSWVTFPRPKTGINRRCPLWPETVAGLQAAIATRPAPNDDSFAHLVFLTRFGGPWAKDDPDSPVSKETRKLLDELDLHRRGLGFYALRHTFETMAGETTDQVAVDFIMGHARDDMASLYRERISDERLRAVTDYVRAWLFGSS